MIDPSSNDVHMVGIYGFEGIGKTTISKVLYNRIVAQFMITSFLANVREDSKSRHLLSFYKNNSLMISYQEEEELYKQC